MSAATQTGQDPVLTALRADFAAKSAEVEQIIADPAVTPERLSKAKSLNGEIKDLRGRISSREADLATIAEIRTAQDDSKAWAAEVHRPIPFPSRGGRPDVQGEGRDGKRFRIDTGDSEVDKKSMTGGFRNLGHFAWATAKKGRDGYGDPAAAKALAEWDGICTKMVHWEAERKAPSGMFEMSDPDGGLLVPPQFSNQIYQRMVDTNQILQRLSPIPITSNQLKLRALMEDSRVDGSRGGGILGYWEGEADQYQKSKTKFRPIELNLHKLTVFTFVTEELLADSDIAIDTFIGNLAAKEINFKLNDAILNGTGNGMPEGILASGSKITVSAVSAQGAGTIIFPNVLAMYSRVVAGQRGSLIWLYNQDVEPQLFGLYQATGTAAGVLIFVPNQARNGFDLMGRPAIVVEQAKSLGTAGDVIAFATDGYVCATKGGIQSFMSMHLRFDFDEFAYKWRFRFDGQMWDDAPLTPYNGSNTVSSVVVLSSTRT